MGSDPGGDWLRAVTLAHLKNFVRGSDPINSKFRICLEKFNGVRPQCRQPKVNLRLVTKKMISQRQREIEYQRKIFKEGALYQSFVKKPLQRY